MSKPKNKTRVTNSNLYSRNQAARRRVESITRNSKENSWALSTISSGLDTDTVSELKEVLASLTSPRFAPVMTSVEDLRNWGNTRNGIRLGDLVATNVPVCCTGCLVNSDGMNDIAETREGYVRPPKHQRWGAHGLSFGSVFLKTFRGTEADGSTFVKEVKTFAACNNCLDTWVGPLAEGGSRSTSLWPFKPYVPQDNGGRKKFDDPRRNPKDRKSHDKKSDRKRQKAQPHRKPQSKPVNQAFGFILKGISPTVLNGKAVDPWKKVTVTMLSSFVKDRGLVPKRVKADLLAQLNSCLTASEQTLVREKLDTRD